MSTAHINRAELREMAKTMTMTDLCQHYGVKHPTLFGLMKRQGIRAAKIKRDKYPNIREEAKSKTILQLAEHYGVSLKAMRSALKKRHISAVDLRTVKYPGLDEYCKNETIRELAERFGVGHEAMRTVLKKRGLVAKKAARPRSFQRTQPERKVHYTPRATRGAAPLVDNRAKTIADLAADHMRRFAPVYRCREDGTPDFVGQHYCYGRRVKTADELMSLARRHGWKPETWADLRVAA